MDDAIAATLYPNSNMGAQTEDPASGASEGSNADGDLASKLYPKMAEQSAGSSARRGARADRAPKSAGDALASKLYRGMNDSKHPGDGAEQPPQTRRGASEVSPERKSGSKGKPVERRQAPSAEETAAKLYPKMAEQIGAERDRDAPRGRDHATGADGRPPGATEPASLELDAPEGFDASSPLFGEFRKVAGEIGLDQEQASRVLELHQRALAQQDEAWAAQVTKWEQDFGADAEIGGGRRDESLSVARAVVEEFGTPALFDALDAHGYGSHPEVIRLLTRIGRELRDLRDE